MEQQNEQKEHFGQGGQACVTQNGTELCVNLPFATDISLPWWQWLIIAFVVMCLGSGVAVVIGLLIWRFWFSR